MQTIITVALLVVAIVEAYLLVRVTKGRNLLQALYGAAQSDYLSLRSTSAKAYADLIDGHEAEIAGFRKTVDTLRGRGDKYRNALDEIISTGGNHIKRSIQVTEIAKTARASTKG